MKTLTKFTFVGLVFLATSLLAQTGKINKADKMFDQFSFVDAREVYLEVVEKGFESADLYKKIADSYYFNADYDEASIYYDKLISNYPSEVVPEYYFRYAQTLRALKDYSKADSMMTAFNKVSNKDYRADLFVESPDYLSTTGYRASNYTLEDIKTINSRKSDFAPMLYDGKLIFATARDSSGGSRRIHKWNNQPFLDLYESKVGEASKSYSKPEPFSKELNSRFHESTTTFTNDGKTVYFTRNNYNQGKYGKAKEGTNKLKIYKSSKKNGKWGTPVEMPFNSDEYSTAHPALNQDNTRLYFSSDMEGTLGLSDIWYVDISEDGSYGEPVNLQKPINTEGRESFPFMSDTNNLYFASDGHPGLGGLDIFVTTPDDKEGVEEEIINLGEPINSSYDDFSFIVKDSILVGYFASNRKRGLGSDDIYKFNQEIACAIIADGVTLDKDSNEPIGGVTVELIDKDSNVINSTVSDDEGNYKFESTSCEDQYIVRGIKEDYNGDEKLFNTPNVSGTVSNNLYLELAKKPLKVGDDLAKVLDLNPIYFDFDRFNIRRDAALELEKVVAVLNEYPAMFIDVRSHTDSRARDAYNEKLSEKRNKSTIAYLIDQGINSSRLTGRGYGESQLVNGCSNGVDCSEEEHQLNRRSEFIIVKM